MDLESLRYIVSRLERVKVVRPTYTIFSLQTVSQWTFELYSMLVLSTSLIEGKVLLEIIRLGV